MEHAHVFGTKVDGVTKAKCGQILDDLNRMVTQEKFKEYPTMLYYNTRPLCEKCIQGMSK